MNFRALLEPHGDAANAVPMAAYMKHNFPFLGIPAPQRRAATQEVLKAAKKWPASELRDAAERLWNEPEREFHQLGVDILDAGSKQLSRTDLPWIEGLCRRNQWWDSIDGLSSPVINAIVLADPNSGVEVEAWGSDPDFWLRRVAIISQRRSKEKTNEDWLFRVCLLNAADKQFFIRKGIGWALREYAKTNPEAVRSFLETHGARFSPFTLREASKYL